ncbi:TIGR03985 family CRISPR-associated protein [Umezakia ovalisporum]|uniref:TIGR03985 family CRISPR-associated protein n=1 Tax=Umezakia ovalisporum FSS-43 TaxID=2740520 RepID=A0ABT6K2T2_9CYAN|nr:TIGR03985 family CRISPR-associated protein [Umezakia ovalisporum]MDH6056410.1 TIGR03985 family CRISPR-associated protein [Umezakia ovalisporum FSS-43]MDH6072710.1 TIGR03985 family CRISPR-associated protein [Umezakia ovalisporum CobakiLakeA]MDH6081847.1 TIGR03985 family CRISPR-associated protein [Umezakia ovalisporum FSS-44]MDH6096611.1 TIGR03985 family CRISPR-associated protein [Umezakia ovalisporum CobakiLakeB]
MSEPIFVDTPQVELLQWLARGSLKQNLLRAIRLWVWLRSLYGLEEGSLYGSTPERLLLNNSFTFAHWRDAFFSSTHPKGEAIPHLHDQNCPCAKTTAAWLFNSNTELSEPQWRRSLITHAGVLESDVNKALEKRLFSVTRRSLQADLQILTDMGWLEYRAQKYHCVKTLPSRPITTSSTTIINNYHREEFNFLNQEDLVAIAQNHSAKICGVQRFFCKLDYISPRHTIDKVDDWCNILQKIWKKTPVPPVQLTYNSASLRKSVKCTVYPVCSYYVQRAVYLCAFGQSPDGHNDWYNYRLDRIQNIRPINWTDISIPLVLQQRYQQANLPNPEDIETQMSKAWGFDFYLPPQLMLLRFDRDHHDLYIQDTVRHNTFEVISYQQAKTLIRQHTPIPEQRQALLTILKDRSPQDAYYRVQYRHLDHDVSMRIRAWRPKAEVILPWDLRQKVAADILAEHKLYLN